MKRPMKRLALALALALSAAPAMAVTPNEVLPDAALEARAREVSKDLRCLVCRNENIDDSHAPLAHDLRVLVRERITAGDSNEQVKDYLVERYGEFILLRPRFNARTAVLWLAPALLLGLGLVMAWSVSRRPEPPAPAPLTDEERRKLEALMEPKP